MYYRLMLQLADSLANLKNILTKAQEHAQANNIPEQDLLNARLAPDMFHLIRQIQTSTDNAKNAAARLSGTTAPVFEDNEETFAQLQDRLERAITYIRSFNEVEFNDAATQKVTLPFVPGMYALGEDYVYQFVIPNFYFHVTTAYAILRNQGVPLGKRDYVAHVNFKPLER